MDEANKVENWRKDDNRGNKHGGKGKDQDDKRKN